ncbi:MAG: TrmH family RNA methyltransferase [Planctomycetota bacterium]|nr:MAG: TrmH family RNA methyltransferase [Planctomycetota bacterium]
MTQSRLPPAQAEAPRRLRRAEAVLARRTQRILLVLERCWDSHNHQAALRTADAFGVQHVWTVEPELSARRLSNNVTKGAWRWLSLKQFHSTPDLIAALRADRRTIWATDLSRGAEELRTEACIVPARLAIVIGREADGVSAEMLAAADRRVYLPMQGFTGSFNLSVATALTLQRLFDACPEARGDLPESEKAALRELWYRRLAKSEETWAEYQAWLEAPPPPLPELRPEDAFRQARVPAKIRRRNAHELDEDPQET